MLRYKIVLLTEKSTATERRKTSHTAEESTNALFHILKYAFHTAEQTADALSQLFKDRTKLTSHQKKPPAPYFNCLVLDLPFSHKRKSRQHPLSFILRPNYASNMAEDAADALFNLLKGRNKFPSPREKPPMPSFTCLVLDLRVPPDRNCRRRPLLHV